MGGETAVKNTTRDYMERVWEYYERENAGKKYNGVIIWRLESI